MIDHVLLHLTDLVKAFQGFLATYTPFVPVFVQSLLYFLCSVTGQSWERRVSSQERTYITNVL